jgi:hypothetical protein
MEPLAFIQAVETREEKIRTQSTRVTEERKETTFLLLGFFEDTPLFLLHEWDKRKEGSQEEYLYSYIFFSNGEPEIVTIGKYSSSSFGKQVIERGYKFSSSILGQATQCKANSKKKTIKIDGVSFYRFKEDLEKINKNGKYNFMLENNKITYK